MTIWKMQGLPFYTSIVNIMIHLSIRDSYFFFIKFMMNAGLRSTLVETLVSVECTVYVFILIGWRQKKSLNRVSTCCKSRFKIMKHHFGFDADDKWKPLKRQVDSVCVSSSVLVLKKNNICNDTNSNNEEELNLSIKHSFMTVLFI